jgi:signal transduction histidine kinase
MNACLAWVRPVADRSVTMRAVHVGPLPLDVETRQRLVEAARLATVGRLVASVVHQMSTPLAAISLRAESLEQSVVDPDRSNSSEKTLRYLHAIGEETARCKELLAALREFGGPLDPGAEPVDMAALCRSAVLLVRDEGLRRQLDFKLDLAERLGRVHGRKGRLGQAVLALLLNAIDASPQGARVTIEARGAAPADVIISVSDEGSGIPEEARDSMFWPFVSTRSPDHGAGLGLTASRAVAEQHGGTLEADSSARGSRFVLRLPTRGFAKGRDAADAGP